VGAGGGVGVGRWGGTVGGGRVVEGRAVRGSHVAAGGWWLGFGSFFLLFDIIITIKPNNPTQNCTTHITKNHNHKKKNN